METTARFRRLIAAAALTSTVLIPAHLAGAAVIPASPGAVTNPTDPTHPGDDRPDDFANPTDTTIPSPDDFANPTDPTHPGDDRPDDFTNPEPGDGCHPLAASCDLTNPTDPTHPGDGGPSGPGAGDEVDAPVVANPTFTG